MISTRVYWTVPVLLALAACGGGDVKESLGLTHRAPDEFRVYSRPPLSVPPEFALRPPGEAGSSTANLTSAEEARAHVLGNAAPTPQPSPFGPPSNAIATPVAPVLQSDLPSNADAQFLANAGANAADPQVRSALAEDGEARIKAKDDRYLITPTASGEPIVDPAKEAARVKQNKAASKPITAGDTPVIVPKDKGLLGSIF